MKKLFCILLCLMLSFCIITSCDGKNEEQTDSWEYGYIIHVASDGNDSNDGSEKAPLATISGAVAKVSDIISSSGLPDGGVKIEFLSGRYRISESFDFTIDNCGKDDKPICFAAAKGADVIFDGGVLLDSCDFKPVTDDNILSLLSEDARSNVLCIDLSGYDIHEIKNDEYLFQELSVNGKSQVCARWPNGTDHAITDIGKAPEGYSGVRITAEQAEKWTKCDTISFFGYGSRDWNHSVIRSGSYVDLENCLLCVPNELVKHAPMISDMPYYVFNLLCELDEPGEYFRDNINNILYYWPSSDINSSDVVFGSLDAPAFNLDEAENLSFTGIIFENFPYGVFHGTVNDLSVCDSVIRSCYGAPFDLVADNVTIDGCEICDLGGAGIIIQAGDMPTLRIGNITITNCDFHDVARIERTNNAPIRHAGKGFYIAHNYFHDCPHHAIEDLWDWDLRWPRSGPTIIEYNEFSNCSYFVADTGVIHIGASQTTRDYIVRYNYIHDIDDILFTGEPTALYFDDMCSGIWCYSNICVNIAGSGITVCGGRYCYVYNNVLVNVGGPAIGCDARAMESWANQVNYYSGQMWGQVKDYFTTDIWRYAMPEILLAHESVTYPTDGTKITGMDGLGTPSYNIITDNIGYNVSYSYSCPEKTGEEYIVGFHWDDRYLVDGLVATNPFIDYYGTIGNNINYTDSEDTESLFVDYANGNCFLPDDSRIYRDIIGFEKWDYNQIGINK